MPVSANEVRGCGLGKSPTDEATVSIIDSLRGNVFKVSFCLEGSEYFTNLLNVAMFLLQWMMWFLIQKVDFSFLLCSPLMDQILVTLFTHLIQMDLPVLVPLSQLDKREDQLNREIDELNG